MLALLILQASFLVPPFGYSVMMVRNRLGRALASGPFARALLPFLAAQLLVVTLVLAFPALVWRSGAAEALRPVDGGAATDDEARAMFLRQLQQNESGTDAETGAGK